MKLGLRSLWVLAIAAWLGLADAAPVAAFDGAARSFGAQDRPAGRVVQDPSWAQIFDQNRRRERGFQRRQRRTKDVIPLRTDPGRRQLRMQELRREERNRKRRQEQDAAREAVRRGDILPLGGIIRSVRSACPGKFLDANLQRGRDGYFYRVRILRPSGRRIALLVDAKSAAVIGGRCR